MLNTTTVFEGNLAATPEMRFTPSGKHVLEFTVLVNRRRQDQAGEWVDEEPTRHQVKAFGQLAENIADSAGTGDRLIVAGSVVTETWTDKDTGTKRTAPKVLADAVGISLRWVTTTTTKNDRTEQAV